MKFLLLALLTLFATPVFAGAEPGDQSGGVVVDDQTNTLSAREIADINSAQGRWPFDVKIFFGFYDSKTALDAAVSTCVDHPNKVCIGVDPKLRSTFTHFGVGTNVPKYDHQVVARAGLPYFKRGEWGNGAVAIADSAARSIKNAQTPLPSTEPKKATETATPQHTSSGTSDLIWLLIFFGPFALLGLGIGLYALYNRQKKLDKDMGSFREERNEMALANGERLVKTDAVKPKPVSNSPAPAHSYRPTGAVAARNRAPARIDRPNPMPTPAPAPVVVQNNDGFMTGFLVGQATSSPPRSSPPPAPSPSPSFSWPSPDPSPSPSFDWGGSGGDFGGGGGFDGGGGGGDF